ncbi:MAG: glycosyltransferase family 117 protein, partial [Anaerolineae bacterium]
AIALALALGSSALYLRTMAPTVWFGNSAAQQYGSYILAVLYPTGYPLFTLLGKLFTFLPIGDIAYRVNLLSAASSAACVGLLYLFIRHITEKKLPALLPTLAFALSETFWSSAVVSNVYALNIFFVALTSYLVLRWSEEIAFPSGAWHFRSARRLVLFAFTYGLSLTHHRMMVLLGPAFILFFLLNALRWREANPHPLPGIRHTAYGIFVEHLKGNPFLKPQRLSLLALAFLLPLLIYLYIPLRAQVLLSEEDPANAFIYPGIPEAALRGKVTSHYKPTLQGFLDTVTGRQFVEWQVGIESWGHFLERVGRWLGLVLEQFGPLGMILGFIGAFRLPFTKPRQAALLWAAYLGVLAYHLPLGHSEHFFYLLPSHIFFAAWMGVGMDYLWTLITLPSLSLPPLGGGSGWGARRTFSIAYYAFWLIIPLSLLHRNYAKLDMSQAYEAQTYARQVLSQPLEEKAVLAGPAGLAAAVRYFQYVEGQRPDLIVISAELSSKGGKKLMRNCMEAGRPLYLLDFPTEESKLAHPPYGVVQLIPLPLYGEPDLQHPLQAELEDKLFLLGYDVERARVEQGTAFHLTLYWHVSGKMEQDYHVFIHLLDADGKRWSQVDRRPVSVYFPTSQWQVGQTFRDEYWMPIPKDAPAGQYFLELGMYSQETMERLAVLNPQWHERDSVRIEGLEVQVPGTSEEPGT